jgi:hypothetical protein
MPNPGDLDFASLRASAQSEIDKVDAAEAGKANVDVAPTETATPEPMKVSQQQAQAIVDPSSSAEPKSQEQKAQEVFDIPDTASVKVKIDGEEQILTYKDYKDILRKNATVTQRMQQFAKSRDEFNSAVQAKLAEIEAREKAILERQSQKDPLQEALINALKGQVEPKPRDPNEIVTLGDVQKERENLLKQFEDQRSRDRQEFEQNLARAAQSVQDQAQLQRERQEYLGGLNSILAEDTYKAMNELIPNFSASVMFHVKQLQPQNLQEALEYSRDFIEDRYKVFKKLTVAQEQAQQAQAAKAKMESAEGTPVSAMNKDANNPKRFVNKAGKLDWAAMQKDALARANSMV